MQRSLKNTSTWVAVVTCRRVLKGPLSTLSTELRPKTTSIWKVDAQLVLLKMKEAQCGASIYQGPFSEDKVEGKWRAEVFLRVRKGIVYIFQDVWKPSTMKLKAILTSTSTLSIIMLKRRESWKSFKNKMIRLSRCMKWTKSQEKSLLLFC